MALRFLAVGSLALLAAMTASSAISPSAFKLKRAVTPGHARLYAIGIRSAQQVNSATDRKLDSVLADLTRHASQARPGHVLEDLHSLSPAARFTQVSATGTPLVLVDAATRGSPEQLKAALVGLGLQRPAVYANDVGGWLPVSQIESAAARTEVDLIRAALPHKRASVATQGDYAQASSVLRTDYPTLTGTGITVGMISDSFNCYAVYAEPDSGVPVSGYEGYASNGFTADYASDETNDALPSGVNVIAEADCLDYGAPAQPPLTDEGRAMLQVVHVVAPGASLAFYSGFESEADFASGIKALAAAGANVIGDDLGYFDEPFFEDGIVAQAIDTVEAQGVAYFSAAGNDGMTPSYQNTAPAFPTLQSSGNNANEYLLNFDSTGATTTTALPITVPPVPPGDFLAVVVEWDQPYVTGCTATATTSCTGASSQLDLCITGGTGSDEILNYDTGSAASCTGLNATGADPYQILIVGNPASATGNTQQQNLNIVIGLANGSTKPGRIIVSVEDDGLGSTINQFTNSSGPTIQGHPGAAGAAAVGAAFYFDTPRCGTTPAQLETYSSEGGAPILFDGATGARLATAVVRQKPDFVGPDGVNTTFLGFTLASDSPPYPSNGLLNTSITECQNNPKYPNFFGTSAATPHAASIAALLLQANSTLAPTDIYSAMQQSASSMGGTTPNFNSGYGFIQANAALALIAPGPPTLSLAATSVTVGSSTTLTWSSIIATSCTASGSWSGTQATSGSQTITPTAAGTETFSLTCSNSVGTSTASTATLTATAAATTSSSSGGGGLDGSALLGLAGLCGARWLGARRRRTA